MDGNAGTLYDLDCLYGCLLRVVRYIIVTSRPDLSPHSVCYSWDDMKRIAITACPYSATRYTSLLLGKLGLDVGHEQYGADGIVSWQHIHMSKADFITEGFDSGMVLAHQVRHPLMVISTLRQIHIGYKHPDTKRNLWAFIKEITEAMRTEWNIADETAPQDKVNDPLIWMRLWYWWNKVGIEKADWFYRIEDLPSKWPRFLDKLDVERVDMPEIGKTINRKKTRKILSWDDLYAVHPGLTLDILDLASKFGYNQEPTEYLADEFYEFPEQIELSQELLCQK